MATTRSEKITFPGALGNLLAARLDLPEGRPPRAFAVFAHCFTCSKDVFAVSRVSNALAERGIGVLRFDFTGLGSSEGDFGNSGFSSNVADLLAAVNFLRDTGRAPKLLIGHSLGGAAVLAAALRLPDIAGVVTINAPADPAHVLHLLSGSREEIEREGRARVSIAGREFSISRSFIEDVEESRLLHRLGDLRKALLIFHAPQDQTVGIDNAALIFKAAKHPKSFVSLDGADHLLTAKEDAIYVGSMVASWAERYLEAELPAEIVTKAIEPGVVLVEEAGKSKFAQNVTAGRHALRADEPVSYGGTDTGPGPYDLLLASLGACTSMTIRMYASRKQIPLKHVAVRLRHEKIHAQDCAECATKGGKIDQIEREIELHGDLDQETRQRLLEIADKCPVHRTLHSEISITTIERRPAST